jgi:small subunit ribosomal protein S5
MKEHEQQLEERVLYVNRCAKVVKGGRKFSFSALVLVGNGAGSVGFGFAKANELTDAIKKGGDAARKNMKTFKFEGTTLPHELTVKSDGVTLFIKPSPRGSGVVAGSKVRAVFELAGVHDIMAKNLGSSNPYNQVKAVFKALDKLFTRDEIRAARAS